MRDPDSILLIEDENLVVETLKGNFQEKGFQVTTARNGEEGVRKFQNQNFDLVITDLKLRGMDGFQVSRKINKLNPKTPVILVTGYPKLLSAEEASRFGVRDFILKPFSWDQLLKKVTDCLDSRTDQSDGPSGELSFGGIPRKKLPGPSTPSRLERRPERQRKDPYHHLSQFLFGQTRALEMLMRGEPLIDIFQNLIQEMEGCADEVAGSIHLVDSGRTQLELVAGPSLPGPLSREIQRIRLSGAENPWKGTVTQNKPVFVEDIRNNPLWEGCSLASKICGFRGSWSFPLRTTDQKVAGVLTFYSRAARSPSTVELKWILSATRLLGTLLKYKQLEANRNQGAQGSEGSPMSGEEAVIMLNENGLIDACNTKAAKLFGYPGKGLIGQNIKNLISGKGPTPHSNPFQRIDSGDETEFGTRKAAAIGLHQNGSRLFLNVSVGEMALRDGRKFVATVTDVSKLKFAEKVFKETQDSLAGLTPSSLDESNSLKDQLVQSEKWAATGKLAASLAHEFKNPLFGILNVLERASREFSLKQGSEDLLELAIQECYRVMELVKKLQDFQRPSSHSAEPMDLNAAIRDIALLTQARLDKRNVELKLEMDRSIPHVVLIEDQIKQVILNLLNNAEEAVEPGKGKIAIHTRALESSLQVIVRDNGKGIADSEREKIFEPFYTTKADSGGMGLGLPISCEIIKAQGGRLEVQRGEGGKGTTFILTLPKRTAHRTLRRADRHGRSNPTLNNKSRTL